MKRICFLFVGILFTTIMEGQVNISGGSTVTQNFGGMTNLAASALPTGWRADKVSTVRTVGVYSTASSATEQVGSASMSTTAANGIYNFGAGTASPGTSDRAVGGLSSGSASQSVNVYVDLLNNGVGTISSFTISYDVEKYRKGSNAAGFSIQMYYSTNGTTWTNAGANFATSFAADADNTGYATVPGATSSVTNKTISVSIPAGTHLYLAWNYSVSSGSTTSNAQALGIDNISIEACTPTTWYEDSDNDGLGNSAVTQSSCTQPPGYVAVGGDNCPNDSNPLQEDNDGDNIGDVCDPDDDNDGILDGVDNCPLVANSGQEDNDGDNVGNVCDPDDDNDGILDGVDNCPLVANSGQEDNDLDNIGDACDPDDDNDGVVDGMDNCSLIPNPDQTDTDGDGLGNICDPDDDNDGIQDGLDNCPLVQNLSQLDTDGDGIGNACDPDDDGDGILDVVDNCPLISNSSQLDTDGDNFGDACDPDDDNDGDPDFSDCAPLNSAIHSGATEVCNGVDDNCDGFIDNVPVTITASASANGSITPPGATAVNCGDDITYTITPDPCYQIATLLIDGVGITPTNSYTFFDVTVNHTISATFTPILYSITASAGPNGTITPSGAVNVNCGGNASFTIVANSGYAIQDVVVDNISVGAQGSYTFNNVTGPHTIVASFVSTGCILKVHNTNTNIDYCTIQAAIDDPLTLNGHTIVVDPGTYNESLNIHKWVQLKGAQYNVCAPSRSGLESIINCTNGIGINADFVSINGFTIQGQTGTGAPGWGFAVYMAPGTEAVALTNNIIKNNIVGTALTNSGASPGLAIIDCNWYDNNNNPGPASGQAIYLDQFTAGGIVSNVHIGSNKFSNHQTMAIDVSVSQASMAATGFTIQANEFVNNHRAFFLYNLNNSVIRYNEISGSTFTGSGDIRIFGGVNNLAIENNKFVAGLARGIRISEDGSGNMNSGITVTKNSFSGYSASNYAIEIASGYAVPLQATCNWFGSTVPSFVASEILGAAVFVPYLTSGSDMAIATGFQTFESCSACNVVAGITNNSSTTVLTCTTTSISVTATGGVSYAWDNGLGNSANANITAPGTYTVTVTGADGCTDTESITITQGPDPVIIATAGPNGAIAPAGSTSVSCNGSQAYTITADPGYIIQDVLVDAVSVGAVGNYTFTNVTTDHTISASFVTACPPKVHNINTLIDYCTIQAAIDDALTLNGHTIVVDAGTYPEDVVVHKSLTIQGAGASTTTIVGQIGGPQGATVRFTASNNDFSGFTITRDGNNPGQWNDPGLNSAGIAIQGLTISNVNIHDNIITGNRSAIDINNSGGHTLNTNVIDNNHTGVIFRNQTDNMTMENNFITNNRTVGILFLDASGGTNTPVQQAANGNFHNNNISGNWYGEIVDRQAGGSLPAPGTTNMKNFTCNWYGSTAPVITTANSAEPGYSVLIPVIFGGGATPPAGQPDIAGPASANFTYQPFLTNGTDNSPAFGFQPVPNSCNGCSGGVLNVNTSITYCTIQAAIDAASTLNGHTISVPAGTYNEDVNVHKTLTIMGAGASSTTIVGQPGGDGATVRFSASNSDFGGFKITRAGNNLSQWNDPTLNSTGVAIQGQAITGINIHDNHFVGNRTGIDINNSNGHTIINNLIDDNRTGLIFRNQTDNMVMTNNFITNNWTVGVLFLDASGGTNSPVQTAANGSFNNNNISGNWYGQIVDRQSGGSLPAPGTTNMKNFLCNWYGSTSPVITTANSAEPGYAAQIPVAYGGSAVAPGGQPDIAGPASANFNYINFLMNGTDNSPAFGFQPLYNACASLTYADPALVSIDMTDLSNVVANPNLIPYQAARKIHIPVLNLTVDPSEFIPAGTAKLRISLGTHLALNPGYILSNSPLNDKFNWTSTTEGDSVVIYGDLIADIPGDYADVTSFEVKGIGATGGTSLIRAYWMISNHNNPNYFLVDQNIHNDTTTLNYTELSQLTLNIQNISHVTCNGYSNGSVTVIAAGGAVPYQYQLDAGPLQPSPTFSGLPAGTYTVTVYDFIGQTASVLVNITEPPAISVFSTTVTPVACYGANTGSIVLVTNGGTGPHSYSIAPNMGTQGPAGTFTGLPTGSYVITVTDQNNCVLITAPILVPTAPQIIFGTPIVNHVDCYGGNDGSITVSASGGTGTITYSILPNLGIQNPSGTFNNLPAGNYTISATDENNCVVSIPVTVTEPTEVLFGQPLVTHVTCNGYNNGSIVVSATGGTGTITYSISPNIGTQTPAGTFNNLFAGNYQITATDANGCTDVINVTVNQPTLISFSNPVITHVTCFGYNNGSIVISANGGTGLITYSISPNVGAQGPAGTFTGLTAGNYLITATDANQCYSMFALTVQQPNLLQVTATGTNVTCNGYGNGTATANPTGGTGPYSYSWIAFGGGVVPSGQQNNQTLTGLVPGTYVVTVNDANNCGPVFHGYTVTQPDIITAGNGPSFVITHVTCNGAGNGAIDLTIIPQGGTAPYSYAYLWTKVGGGFTSTQEDISGLVPGDYNVVITVTDANGCTATFTGTATVTEPPLLNISVTGLVPITCAGTFSGSITVTATGGTSPYEFSINNGGTWFASVTGSHTFSGLNAGTYTIQVRDANGCIKSVQQVLGQPANPEISLGSVFDNNLFFANGDEVTVVYNIAELNGKAGTPATLRIFKPAGYDIIFDNSITSTPLFPAYTLDNPKWNFLGAGPNNLYYDFGRTGPGGNNTINCNELVRIAFRIKRNTPNITTFNLNAQFRVVPGELIFSNNNNSIVMIGE